MTENKTEDLRVIKTARSIFEINDAVDAGFFPLVKRRNPSNELSRTVAVFRNVLTNKIMETHAYIGFTRDGRFSFVDEREWELVVPFHEVYPYKFELTYAAYLIPPDITVGETVVLEDLIEDYYGGDFWGHSIRKDSLKAIWTGDDFSILYNRDVDGVSDLVG